MLKREREGGHACVSVPDGMHGGDALGVIA